MENDYKTRMVEEYHELKERISKLDDAVTRYKRGELEFNPKCLGGMIVAQLYIMQDYLHVLFDRIKAMGISLDSDDEPDKKPLPEEPKERGFYVTANDGLLLLKDVDDDWSARTCYNSANHIIWGGDRQYVKWPTVCETLPPEAFPLKRVNTGGGNDD